MADFLMPSLGADMESGTLTEWLVKPGDTVKRGDVVASVETSKGIIDVEIFADGVIEALLVAPGAEVPVGHPLARYRATGAAEPPAAEPRAPPAPAKPAPAPSVRAPSASPPGEARRAASPAARKRAGELGIDLGTVVARSGGPITLQDVEQAGAAPAPRPADMRGTIGQSMSRSKREIPHYYLATTIDLRRALRWLEQHNAAHAVTDRLIYSVLLVKAVARAAAAFPELNGWWREDRFDAAQAVNVGTAIRLRDGGLIAPALLGADRRPLAELMRAYQDLVQRARSGGLRATELASATITVSSIGEGGVDTLYPIVHPPQVAIVGFGTTVVRRRLRRRCTRGQRDAGSRSSRERRVPRQRLSRRRRGLVAATGGLVSSMTADALRTTVLEALLDVAPDVDAGTLDATRPFRDQFDFDSMDQLNFVVGLHERLGVDVPETDYPQLTTLSGCVDYLARSLNVPNA